MKPVYDTMRGSKLPRIRMLVDVSCHCSYCYYYYCNDDYYYD